jgi:hypothetical protein
MVVRLLLMAVLAASVSVDIRGNVAASVEVAPKSAESSVPLTIFIDHGEIVITPASV